ncbi:hypothetical protein ACIP1U_25125 [Cupriavidus sp. NPDC089707]
MEFRLAADPMAMVEDQAAIEQRSRARGSSPGLAGLQSAVADGRG